jgi:glycosyltransferase involved in cell wall biosynthesis
MHPVKGAHRAIKAARLAGRELMLAGPVQTGQEEYFRELVEPHIDGRRVHYLGEVGGRAKQELFANAAALLMPVRWSEPFGMVMVRAVARLGSVDPRACRASVAERYSMSVTAAGYERVYRRAIHADHRRHHSDAAGNVVGSSRLYAPSLGVS